MELIYLGVKYSCMSQQSESRERLYTKHLPKVLEILDNLKKILSHGMSGLYNSAGALKLTSLLT